jgi:hypothetical protein
MDYPKLEVSIRQGSTENIPFRVETDEWAYAPIELIYQTAPVKFKVTGHALPEGWRVAVMNVLRPKDLNAEANPPGEDDLRQITVVDADHVEFNDVNGAGFAKYSGGGQLAWRKPLDLSIYTQARANVRATVGGTLRANWSTANGKLEIDVVKHAIWFRLPAADTALLTAGNNVFDIELVTAGGEVERLCLAVSVLTVLPENTTE